MTAYDPEDFFEMERLHRAAADGDINEMQRLVEEGYTLEVFDDLGKAPLHYAVEGQHYKAVEWLIAAGAKVNSNDEAHIGETPLCHAAKAETTHMVAALRQSEVRCIYYNGSDEQVIKLLKSKGDAQQCI